MGRVREGNTATEQKSYFAKASEQATEALPTVVSPHLILSGPTKVDLTVYHGDSGRFRVVVKDDANVPIDLTGYTFDADIRTKATDPVVITNFVITPVAGVPSSFDVILTPESSELLTGPCVYDIEIRKMDTVTTLIYGAITITQDVSRP
jgi:hypothetical protein